ncbi:MAG: hypothetical protein IKD83_01720 [Firmicutes bacterium]|nr:hypothetical protein [Bacillota bacterium]
MTDKQTALLNAMLEESTVTKAAESAGISRTMAYNYLKDKAFQAELKKRQRECINDTVRYLQGNLALCAEVLIGIVEKPGLSDQVKINAINAVFSHCKNMTEQADIIKRIEQLEELIESGDADESRFNDTAEES